MTLPQHTQYLYHSNIWLPQPVQNIFQDGYKSKEETKAMKAYTFENIKPQPSCPTFISVFRHFFLCFDIYFCVPKVYLFLCFDIYLSNCGQKRFLRLRPLPLLSGNISGGNISGLDKTKLTMTCRHASFAWGKSVLLGEIQPKWVLLADPMADISLTTSADVRSDVFRDYCMGPFGGSPD